MDQPTEDDWKNALTGSSCDKIASQLFLLAKNLPPLVEWSTVDGSFGPDKGLEPQLHDLQNAFFGIDVAHHWELLESIQSLHPLISEAITTAVLGTELDIHFVSDCFNELLRQRLRLYDECRDMVVKKFELWASMTWLPDYPIHTNFYSRIVFGCIEKHIYNENQQLFGVAPMSYLIYNWTLLRNTSFYACKNNYYKRLVTLMDILPDDVYLLSALVQGIGASGLPIPVREHRFWNVQLFLERDACMLHPLNSNRHALEFISISRTNVVSASWQTPNISSFVSSALLPGHASRGLDTLTPQITSPHTPPTSPAGNETAEV